VGHWREVASGAGLENPESEGGDASEAGAARPHPPRSTDGPRRPARRRGRRRPGRPRGPAV
jgi:hypothetical protein